jgi:hypothetical protein
MASLKLTEKNGTWTLRADPAMTTEYVSLVELERLAKQSPNAPVMYRHRLPDGTNKTHIFGRIQNNPITIQDHINGQKKIVWEADMKERTESHKELKEWVKQLESDEKYVGVSPQFETYGNENNPDDAELLEWSVTPKPHCKVCEGRIKAMEEKEMIAKLTEMQSTLENIKSERDTFKKKFEDMEATAKAKEETIAKTYESKIGDIVKDLQHKNEDLQLKVKVMEEDAIKARKAPILANLKNYGVSPVSLKRMEAWDEKELIEEEIYQKAHAPQKPITRTMSESRNIAMEADENKGLKQEIANKFADLRKELGLK